MEKYKSNEDFKGKGPTKKRNMERGDRQGAAFLFKASVSSQEVGKRGTTEWSKGLENENWNSGPTEDKGPWETHQSHFKT